MTRSQRFAIAVAAAAAAFITAGEAAADHPLADPDVREIVSSEHRGLVYRGVVVESGRRAALVAEIVAPGDRRRPLRSQERVTSYWIDGERRRLAGRSIALRDVRGTTLRFHVSGRRGPSLRCRYDFGDRRPRAECSTGRDARPQPAPPPGPRPRPRDWSESRQVQDACTRAFSRRRAVSDCLDAVATASFDPSSFVSECARATTGTRAGLSCLRAGASAPVDPSDAVRACGSAVTGSDAVIACVGQAGKTSFDLSRAIRACDRAVTGSSSVLRCVDAAAGARRDPSRVIERCDRRETGSRRVLQCIERELTPRRY